MGSRPRAFPAFCARHKCYSHAGSRRILKELPGAAFASIRVLLALAIQGSFGQLRSYPGKATVVPLTLAHNGYRPLSLAHQITRLRFAIQFILIMILTRNN
jgi:hypothetical protein